MRYALITGAFGGMGSKTVELFATQGYTVFALDKNVKHTNDKVVPIEVDLTNAESVKNAFELVKNTLIGWTLLFILQVFIILIL